MATLSIKRRAAVCSDVHGEDYEQEAEQQYAQVDIRRAFGAKSQARSAIRAAATANWLTG
jgi:hypothetical protein